MTVRGRFAPSPTGRMHLGNARTALLSWLQVRAAGGTFLLRIDDLDRGRCRREHVDTLLRDLEYLGLTWDEPPVYQSDDARTARYRDAVAKLTAQGRVYPCFCTRAEIAAAASAPHGPQDDGPRYGGTCARLSREELAVKQASRRAPALRFRPRPGVTSFVDAVQGPTSQDVEAEVGDFVIRRNDGVASYQLAVVVDDFDSKVTDVLRGDDLLASTPRQLQLYEALSLTPPRYAHVPLWLAEGGRRLAKRTGAFAVAELRERGVPAERVVGVLAELSGLHPGGAPRTAQSLAGEFSLTRLPRTPVVMDEAQVTRRLGLD